MNPEQVVAERNSAIRKWASMVTRRLKGRASVFSHGKQGMVMRKGDYPHPEEKLANSLNYTNGRLNYGEIEYIGFRFERHGVFIHKGVGRGYVAAGNSVVRGHKPSNNVKKYAKDSNRRAGNILSNGPMRRHKDEWFNPIIQANMPELADRVAELWLDAAVNETQMLIK